MSRHFMITASALVCILLATSAAPARADSRSSAPVTAVAAVQQPAGITLPLDASLPGVGVFSGVLRITRFAVVDNTVVAVGLIVGTLVDEFGNITSIIKNVSIPVSLPLPSPRSSIAGAACVLPSIAIGPLDVPVLGIPVHINRIVLDISSVPGAGAALDTLLCTITQMLGNAGSMTDLVTLLNQLLGALGG